MTITNIRKYLPSNMPNTTQVKMMGFPRFNALPKGWGRRTYNFTVEQLELFKALNGVKGEKRQQVVVNEHRPVQNRERTVTVKCKDLQGLHALVEILHNLNYGFEVD